MFLRQFNSAWAAAEAELPNQSSRNLVRKQNAVPVHKIKRVAELYLKGCQSEHQEFSKPEILT